jgi:hypothetical protein
LHGLRKAVRLLLQQAFKTVAALQGDVEDRVQTGIVT